MEESGNKYEKKKEMIFSVLPNSEKPKYREQVMGLLKEYPDQFFVDLFVPHASADFELNQIVLAKEGEKLIGCLFYNPNTHECNWLAVSKSFVEKKKDVAEKLFDQVFNLVPKGTRVFWYVNTEDAVFEGREVGVAFEPARKLYEKMGTTRTRVENKFGNGNHAYLIEKII